MLQLYITTTSPYARLARIMVLEKRLEDRVEIIVAKTRTKESPYYLINPSGRVPYLRLEDGRHRGPSTRKHSCAPPLGFRLQRIRYCSCIQS